MQVAGEGFGITRDVDDAFGRERTDAFHKGDGAAGARRVHDDDVRLFAVSGQSEQKLGRVRADEAHIFDAVELCVASGVGNGIGVQLDGQYLPRRYGREHADGADPRVGVDHAVAGLQLRKFQRLTIKEFCTLVIDLIEGARRDHKSFTEEFVRDITAAIQDSLLLSQHKACKAVVDVLDDRGDLGVLFEQRAAEIVFGFEFPCSRHKHDHDFPGADGGLDQHVAQKAPACLVVICRQFEGT